MKTAGLLATIAATLLGSSLAFAAPPTTGTTPGATATMAPIMSQRGQAAAVRYAMKQQLGITGVKGLKVTLDQKPDAFSGWTGFHAQGAQGANGMKLSVAGTINPFKGRLTDDTGTHSIGHVSDVTLLDTLKPPTTPTPTVTVPPSVKTPATQTIATSTPRSSTHGGMASWIGRAPTTNGGFAYPVTLNGKVVQIKSLGDGTVYIKGLGMGNLTKGLDGFPVFRDPMSGKTTQLGLKTPPHVLM